MAYWYDPMHPEHRFEQPGPSPFMDMALVPRYADDLEPGSVRVAPGVVQRMNLRTARARHEALPREITTFARVGQDLSRIHHLHTRVEGWVERVDVHAVGDPIVAGQALFTLYAPELVNAQEELLHALARDDAGLIAPAREKLRALGVQREAMEEIERNRTVQREVSWRARHSGVITALGIRHGMFVRPGETLLETVDLDTLWLIGEVFAADAPHLALGQPAKVSFAYAPGETFATEVAYVYPELDPVTRAVRVRLPLDNPDGQLRPGMWASIRITGADTEPVLVVPREALIRTGSAHRVVIQDDADLFRVVDVEPGRESGDRVEIRAGLDAGDRVVVSGQFLIDSEASFGAGAARLEGHQHH